MVVDHTSDPRLDRCPDRRRRAHAGGWLRGPDRRRRVHGGGRLGVAPGRALLRVVRGRPPLYNLRVRLLDSPDAFLWGRITPARRLDLEVGLDHAKLGLPDDVSRLTARAELVQGSYSCFRIQAVVRDDLRLSGVLVLWDDRVASSDQVFGVLLLDDTQPEAAARLLAPGAPAPFDVHGPRVRLRAVPFDPRSKALDSLPWNEVLSWRLAPAGSDDADTPPAHEFHLSEVVLSVPTADHPTDYCLIRGFLAGADGLSVQGDFVARIERTADSTEAYTLNLVPSAYAATETTLPAPSETDTLDDVVYPADSLVGPLGRTFDLVEPSAAEGIASDAPVHLVTLIVGEGGAPQLARLDAGDLPFDPGDGPGASRPVPRAPVQIPQLVHREAQGGRIRRRMARRQSAAHHLQLWRGAPASRLADGPAGKDSAGRLGPHAQRPRTTGGTPPGMDPPPDRGGPGGPS